MAGGAVMEVEHVERHRVRLTLQGGQELRISRTGRQFTIRRGYSDGLDGAVLRHTGQVIFGDDVVDEVIEALVALKQDGKG